MHRYAKILCKWVACLLVMAGLALPVGAQGQTPTRPDRSESSSRGGRDLLQRVLSENPPVGRAQNDAANRKPTRPESPQDRPQGKAAAAADEPKASAPKKATAAPSPPSRQPATPTTQTVQGGRTGGGVRTVQGGGGTISVQGQGVFEPIYDKPIRWGDVPDAGEPLTLTGPMGVAEFLDTLSFSTGWNILVTPAAEEINPVSYTHLTLPTKRIV